MSLNPYQKLQKSSQPSRKTIGILGGMGAEATVDLYMSIWSYYQNNFGAKYDNDFPPVIIHSVPIPDVVESIQNEQITLDMLVDAAKKIENSGADFIVIACNSVQFLLNEIRQVVSIPVIGIAEVNADYLKDLSTAKVGLLSTQTTIQKKVYENDLISVGVEIITPDEDEQTIVTECIMAQLAGKAGVAQTLSLTKVVESLKSKGAEAVLLACTDLPLMFSQKDTEVRVIDCTKVYADFAAKLSSNN